MRSGRLAVSAALLFSTAVLLSAVPAARAQEETGEHLSIFLMDVPVGSS
jgi:hypothetical protein